MNPQQERDFANYICTKGDLIGQVCVTLDDVKINFACHVKVIVTGVTAFYAFANGFGLISLSLDGKVYNSLVEVYQAAQALIYKKIEEQLNKTEHYTEEELNEDNVQL
jgi:hypothetical protein